MATKPAAKPAAKPKGKTEIQYVDGLKITSRNFLQRENCWNNIDYSWYHLKEAYDIKTYFTMEFSADIARKYTARGLYCQEAPYEQSLLVTCTDGCAALIVLDLREGSRTYRYHNRLILDASLDVRRSIYIPRGVAYGFVTLEDNTRINFKVDNHCERNFEKTYNMLDPKFGMSVPYPDKTGSSTLLAHLVAKGKLLMSAQDRSAPWIINDGPSVEEEELDVPGDKIEMNESAVGEELAIEEAEAILNEAASNEAELDEMDTDETVLEEAVEGDE